jgi:hypothetical protein
MGRWLRIEKFKESLCCLSCPAVDMLKWLHRRRCVRDMRADRFTRLGFIGSKRGEEGLGHPTFLQETYMSLPRTNFSKSRHSQGQSVLVMGTISPFSCIRSLGSMMARSSEYGSPR